MRRTVTERPYQRPARRRNRPAVADVRAGSIDHLERRAADQHARVEHQRLIAAPLALV